MKGRIHVVLICITAGVVLCGKTPTDMQGKSAHLSVSVFLPGGLAKTRFAHETQWDSLIIEISGSDMTTLRRALPASSLPVPATTETFPEVPAGHKRAVTAWTVDHAGDTIHGTARDTVDLEPNQEVSVVLRPELLRGSIIILLTQFEESIDTVYAAFVTAGNDTFETRAGKANNLAISIDKIPFESSGTLYIAGLSADGKTVTSWSRDNFIFSNTYTTVEASFINVGTVGMDVTLETQKGTIVHGIMDITDSLGDEAGPLVITEIMYYTTGDSDYIEIYNSGTDPFECSGTDTLTLEVVGASSPEVETFPDVTIPAGGYFVVADSEIPQTLSWVDTSVTINLPTTGRWLVLRRGEQVLDVVAYSSGERQWPECDKGYAVVLDSPVPDPEYNNFGEHWVEAVSPCLDLDGHFGTPGKAGK